MIEATDNSSRTVLLIEDSRTQALVLRAMLERKRLRVTWTDSGLQGVEMAQRLHPDLIILDLQLPDIDGLQVCEQLKSSAGTAGIPVIMLTSREDVETIKAGLLTGVMDYIPKDVFAEAVLMTTLHEFGLIS